MDDDNSVATILNIENGIPKNNEILNIRNYKFTKGMEKQIENTGWYMLKLTKK